MRQRIQVRQSCTIKLTAQFKLQGKRKKATATNATRTLHPSKATRHPSGYHHQRVSWPVPLSAPIRSLSALAQDLLISPTDSRNLSTVEENHSTYSPLCILRLEIKTSGCLELSRIVQESPEIHQYVMGTIIAES